MFATEGAKWGEFLTLLKTSRELQVQPPPSHASLASACLLKPSQTFSQVGLFVSGLSFYLYNELATMTIKATGAVTSSVANTAKRVIVMVWMAAVTGKQLTEEQKIGAGVAIGFVLVYSVIDDVVKKFAPAATDKKKKL